MTGFVMTDNVILIDTILLKVMPTKKVFFYNIDCHIDLGTYATFGEGERNLIVCLIW